MVNIWSIFVAFLENMNFIWHANQIILCKKFQENIAGQKKSLEIYSLDTV